MKLTDTGLALPPQQVTLDVLLEKYAKGDEKSVEALRRRVARALAAIEKDSARWEPVFYEALESGFIPGGRVNSAAGTQLQATLINCFVQPVGDSVSETVDGKPGIYVALMESAETMRRGGGVGYDFSAIRPRGARVRGTDSTASGPVSTCASSTRAVKRWSPPARAAAPRWGYSAATTPTWRTLSMPRTRGN